MHVQPSGGGGGGGGGWKGGWQVMQVKCYESISITYNYVFFILYPGIFLLPAEV